MALDSLGTVGTLAAGFVMYNITTFNTEACRLQCYIISMLRVRVRLMITPCSSYRHNSKVVVT